MLESSHAPALANGIDAEFVKAVLHGLAQPKKTLPCRYFYDARGSDLFELITELPEYYLTRSEAALLEANAPEIAGRLSPDHVIVELGAGSSRKMDALLRLAPADITFVPIDVSRHALTEARSRLSAKLPRLIVRPVVDDFSTLDAFPVNLQHRKKLGFFLGSTIGNLHPKQASDMLHSWRQILGRDAELVIGVDLLKDERTLVNAYNDAAGVTALFNLNILARINHEIAPAFTLTSFQHRAFFNVRMSRIEMHLVSRVPQVVQMCGRSFRFAAGESIQTENSYKHSTSAFRSIVEGAGWRIGRMWTDGSFSLYHLV
ncbi:MAG: L-histidine N(alpha)-methyltransferase [Hyphomicrobiaceae bacterium]|nr:L-histidine N(alpha)-methyltransferase [Hyphomicrobiaceae bacterium]